MTWQGDQYVLEIAHDITARKHAEEALEAERAMLARRVDERTAELQMLNTLINDILKVANVDSRSEER